MDDDEKTIIEIKDLVNKPLILFTNKGLRYEGTIISCGAVFIKFKENNGTISHINVASIDRIKEVKNV